jgi:hypothetical protein
LGVQLELGDTSWLDELVRNKLNTERLYETAPMPVAEDFNWFFAWTSSLLAIREYQEVSPT